MKSIAAAALATALMSVTPAAAGVVIYDNLSTDPGSPAYPYNSGMGYGVQWSQAITWGGPGGSVAPFGYSIAAPFTVSTGYDIALQSVSLAMYKWPSGVSWNGVDSFPTNHDNLTIELVGGSAAQPNTGDVIETLSVNPVIPEDSESFLSIDSATHPVLQNGGTYWLIAQPTATSTTDTTDDTVYLWIENTTGAQFYYTANEYGSGWTGFFNQPSTYPAPAFEVVGVSPAPEPGEWMLMLVGLGLTGAALRSGVRAARKVDILSAWRASRPCVS